MASKWHFDGASAEVRGWIGAVSGVLEASCTALGCKASGMLTFVQCSSLKSGKARGAARGRQARKWVIGF